LAARRERAPRGGVRRPRCRGAPRSARAECAHGQYRGGTDARRVPTRRPRAVGRRPRADSGELKTWTSIRSSRRKRTFASAPSAIGGSPSAPTRLSRCAPARPAARSCSPSVSTRTSEMRIKNEILTMVALAVRRDLAGYRDEFPNGTRFALTEIALQRLERSRTQPEGE